MDYKIMKKPPNDVWLTHLRQENVVHLVKEGGFATIEWEYEAPGPRSVCGRVGLRFAPNRKDTWFIHQDGTGMDGSQLLLPVEGHFPPAPAELPPEDIKHILRRLEALAGFLALRNKNREEVCMRAIIEVKKLSEQSYETWLRIGVQGFRIASLEGDEEAHYHCVFAAQQLHHALGTLGITAECEGFELTDRPRMIETTFAEPGKPQ